MPSPCANVKAGRMGKRKGEKNQSVPGVYHILHLPTGKRYVGSSKNCTNRYTHHRFMLRNDRHTSEALQALWNTTQEHEWEFTIIEDCSTEALEEVEFRLHRSVEPELLLNSVVGRKGSHSGEKGRQAALKTWETRRRLGLDNPEKFSEASRKGWEKRRCQNLT